jgi:predicted secreted protein
MFDHRYSFCNCPDTSMECHDRCCARIYGSFGAGLPGKRASIAKAENPAHLSRPMEDQMSERIVALLLGSRKFVGAIFIVSALLLPQAALSGDTHRYRVIGFSKTGDRFVFETYGAFYHGGGHSTFFFLDTRNDKWLKNTPIKVVVEGEPDRKTATVSEIRRRALLRAQKMIGRLGDLDPGFALVSQPLGEHGNDPRAVRFGHPQYYRGSLDNPSNLKLTLQTEVSKSAPHCRKSGVGDPLKFSLRLNGKTVYSDRRLPKSRGCPSDYMISEVLWNHPTDVHIAMIAVFKPGFEGRDRNFIAIPFKVKLGQ